MIENDGKWLSIPEESSTRVQLCSAMGTLADDEWETVSAARIEFSEEEEYIVPRRNVRIQCECVQSKTVDRSTHHMPQLEEDESGGWWW